MTFCNRVLNGEDLPFYGKPHHSGCCVTGGRYALACRSPVYACNSCSANLCSNLQSLLLQTHAG